MKMLSRLGRIFVLTTSLLVLCFPARSQIMNLPADDPHPAGTVKVAPVKDKAATLAQIRNGITWLEDPSTRLSALTELLSEDSVKTKIALPEEFEVLAPDDDIEALSNRAVETIGKTTDFETVKQALDSSDPRLQFFGVKVFQWNHFFHVRANEQPWASLKPKIYHLAVVGSPEIREMAMWSTQRSPETDNFFQRRANSSTSPNEISSILCYLDVPNLDAEFRQHLLRLLNHADWKIRFETLTYFSVNRTDLRASDVVSDAALNRRVRELTQSPRASERGAALQAQQSLKEMAKNAEESRRDWEEFYRNLHSQTRNFPSSIPITPVLPSPLIPNNGLGVAPLALPAQN